MKSPREAAREIRKDLDGWRAEIARLGNPSPDVAALLRRVEGLVERVLALLEAEGHGR